MNTILPRFRILILVSLEGIDVNISSLFQTRDIVLCYFILQQYILVLTKLTTKVREIQWDGGSNGMGPIWLQGVSQHPVK